MIKKIIITMGLLASTQVMAVSHEETLGNGFFGSGSNSFNDYSFNTRDINGKNIGLNINFAGILFDEEQYIDNALDLSDEYDRLIASINDNSYVDGDEADFIALAESLDKKKASLETLGTAGFLFGNNKKVGFYYSNFIDVTSDFFYDPNDVDNVKASNGDESVINSRINVYGFKEESVGLSYTHYNGMGNYIAVALKNQQIDNLNYQKKIPEINDDFTIEDYEQNIVSKDYVNIDGALIQRTGESGSYMKYGIVFKNILREFEISNGDNQLQVKSGSTVFYNLFHKFQGFNLSYDVYPSYSYKNRGKSKFLSAGYELRLADMEFKINYKTDTEDAVDDAFGLMWSFDKKLFNINVSAFKGSGDTIGGGIGLKFNL